MQLLVNTYERATLAEPAFCARLERKSATSARKTVLDIRASKLIFGKETESPTRVEESDVADGDSEVPALYDCVKDGGAEMLTAPDQDADEIELIEGASDDVALADELAREVADDEADAVCEIDAVRDAVDEVDADKDAVDEVDAEAPSDREGVGDKVTDEEGVCETDDEGEDEAVALNEPGCVYEAE